MDNNNNSSTTNVADESADSQVKSEVFVEQIKSENCEPQPENQTAEDSDNWQLGGKARLNDKQWEELTVTRGLDPAWVEANAFSLNQWQATYRLNYKAKSGGIWLEGEGLQGQFKPDRPWKSKDDKKAPKYRSPISFHGYDAMLPKHPNNPTYWTDVERLKELCYQIDGKPYLFVTEGFFKAMAGCINGIPTLALLGVEMGLTAEKASKFAGNRRPVETLQKYAELGFGFFGGFDADCATKNQVIQAELKLGYQLQEVSGLPYYTVTGNWTPEEGKGMDDYIQNNGADKFKIDVLGKARTLEEWEKQLSVDEEGQPKKKKIPSPQKLGQELAAEHQPYWAFHNEQKTWRIWNGKCWEAVDDDVFGQTVYNIVKSRNIQFEHDGYVEGTVKILKRELLQKKWISFDRKRYVAFENGVLDMEEGKLLDHSPGMRFTSFIPRQYSILENLSSTMQPLEALQQFCPHTYGYLMKAMGNEPQRVLKLVAIVNAVLKWRLSEFQMFVHLVGEPGAGKGTFIRLLQGLVGKANHSSATLGKLSEDYTVANIIDSQLVICPDEDRKNGNHGGLKALTGGDDISYREIYKKPASSPFYGGLAVVSNSAIFSGDTTGLERRLCLVSFSHRVAAHERNPKIEQLIESELSALTSVALLLPDIQVEQLIKGIGDGEIPAFRVQSWKMTTDTNSAAMHIEERLVATATDYVEVAKLYDDYRKICDESGRSPMEKTRYSQEIVRIASTQLDWEVSHDRVSIGGKKSRVIRGVRLRSDGFDDDIPLPSEVFAGTAGTAGDSTVTAEKSVLSPYENMGFSPQGQQNSKNFPEENFQSFSTDEKEKNPKNKIEAKTEDVAVPLEPQGFDAVPPAVPMPSPAVTAVPKQKKAKFKPCLGMKPQPWTVKRNGRKIQLPEAYPGTNGHNQTKEPKAIAEQLKTIQSQAEYQALEKLHGERRTLWVFNWLLTPSQQDSVRLIASGKQSQGSLFE